MCLFHTWSGPNFGQQHVLSSSMEEENSTTDDIETPNSDEAIDIHLWSLSLNQSDGRSSSVYMDRCWNHWSRNGIRYGLHWPMHTRFSRGGKKCVLAIMVRCNTINKSILARKSKCIVGNAANTGKDYYCSYHCSWAHNDNVPTETPKMLTTSGGSLVKIENPTNQANMNPLLPTRCKG